MHVDMTKRNILSTFVPRLKPHSFSTNTWFRSTYIVMDVRCRSSFTLDRLLAAILSRLTCVQNKQQTTHAFYLQTNGLEIQTYIY
jgi:hypothetical protein